MWNFWTSTWTWIKTLYKPNDNPIDVDSGSKHPPKVLENIPKGINKRLTSISATKEISTSDDGGPRSQVRISSQLSHDICVLKWVKVSLEQDYRTIIGFLLDLTLKNLKITGGEAPQFFVVDWNHNIFVS